MQSAGCGDSRFGTSNGRSQGNLDLMEAPTLKLEGTTEVYFRAIEIPARVGTQRTIRRCKEPSDACARMESTGIDGSGSNKLEAEEAKQFHGRVRLVVATMQMAQAVQAFDGQSQEEQ